MTYDRLKTEYASAVFLFLIFTILADHPLAFGSNTHEKIGQGSAHTRVSSYDLKLPTDQAIPRVILHDQDGNEVSFPDDVMGNRLIVVNFVFTRCSTICPPMGAAFGSLQRLLKEMPELDVDLLSVSLDPVYDTPGRLLEWANRFDRQPGWTLVTGKKREIDRVLKALDAFSADKTDHAALQLIGHPSTGRWIRIDGLASPTETLDVLRKFADARSVGAARK